MMSKKVLGKGLLALIPTGEKEPEAETPRKPQEKVEKATEIEPPEGDEPEEGQSEPTSPERVIFFNSKTGRYEERSLLSFKATDTREIPVVSGRRRTPDLPVPIEKMPVKQTAGSKNPTTKSTGSRQLQVKDVLPPERKIEGKEIKTFIKDELDIRTRPMGDHLRAALARLRYIEKKIFGDESPANFVKEEILEKQLEILHNENLEMERKLRNIIDKKFDVFINENRENLDKIKELIHSSIEDLEKSLEINRNEVLKLKTEITGLKKENDSYADSFALMEKRIEEIQGSICQVEEQQKEAHKRLESSDATVEKIKSETKRDIGKQIHDEIEETKTIMMNLSNRFAAREKQLEKKEAEFEKIRTLLQTLKEAVKP